MAEAYIVGSEKIPVELSSNADVIKQFLDDNSLLSNTNRAFGETLSSGGFVVPLDVRDFKQRAIHVRNKLDVDVTVRVRFHADLKSTSNGGIMMSEGVLEFVVKPGVRTYLSPTEYPILNDPCVGISVYVARSVAPTAGTIDLVVLGGRV